MEFSELKLNDKENRFYVRVKLEDHPEIFTNVLQYEGQEYLISSEILQDIGTKSGVSKTLYNTLINKNPELLRSNIITLCNYYYQGNLTFLIENDEVVSVLTLNELPLLNSDFLGTLSSMIEDYDDLLHVDSFDYDRDSYQSNVILYHNKDYEYQGNHYRVGVIMTNDELDTVTCRLVVKSEDDLEFYVPAKIFNLTASRYLRNSVDRKEALKLLILRVIDLMSDEERWFSIIPEADMNIKKSERTDLTYEEYKSASRLLRRIAYQSDIEDETVKELETQLFEEFIDFEDNYPMIEEKKNSYLWRCSAISDHNIMDLIVHMNSWIATNLFYPESVHEIKYLIGELIMLSRVVTNLAKRKL